MPTRITAATLTAALHRAGYAERVVQGRGYVYLEGGEAATWFSSSLPGVASARDVGPAEIVTLRNALATAGHLSNRYRSTK
jgi:hypothetical protein